MTKAQNDVSPPFSNERALERLTALWALAEAGMGGFIHAMKIPFTGIVVGSAAVILIAAIGFFARRKASAIFRATMVVVLIKATVSPHSPLPAYFAVLFQGLTGALLFGLLPWPQLAAFLLALLAFWEGAAQKLLVMTFLYGRPLWESVDLVGRRILELIGSPPTTLTPTSWFLLFYAGYYTLGGLITGWLAATLPREIASAAAHVARNKAEAAIAVPWSEERARKPWWRRLPVKAGAAALGLSLLMIWLSPGSTGLERGLRLLARALVAIAIWLAAVRPLAAWIFRRFQRREESRYAADVQRALGMFPSLRAIAAAAWTRTAHLPGWRRWRRFLIELAASALAE